MYLLSVTTTITSAGDPPAPLGAAIVEHQNQNQKKKYPKVPPTLHEL